MPREPRPSALRRRAASTPRLPGVTSGRGRTGRAAATPSDATPRRGIGRLFDQPRDRSLPSMLYITKIAVTLLAVGLVAVLSYQIRGVLLSLFLGLFLAIGFEPIIERLTRRGLRRGLAVLILVIVLLGLLALIVTILLQPAIEQTTALVKQLPGFAQSLMDQLGRLGINFDQSKLAGYVEDAVKQLPDILSYSVGGLSKVLGAIASSVFNVFTVIVLNIYFMLALPRLRASFARLLSSDESMTVVDNALGKIGGYVSGQLTLCFAAGLVSTVVLTLLDVPYPAVIGLIVGIFDAVPQVGAMIASVLSALIALSDGWQPMVITLVVIIVYQQIENYVISPRVFSTAVGLTPLAVFAAVLIGGGVAGGIGAVVALPVTAGGKVILGHLVRGRVAAADAAADSTTDSAADTATVSRR